MVPPWWRARTPALSQGDHFDDGHNHDNDDDDDDDADDDDDDALPHSVLWLPHRQRGGHCPRREKYLLVSKNHCHCHFLHHGHTTMSEIKR